MRIVARSLAILLLTGVLAPGCEKPPTPPAPQPAVNQEPAKPVDPIDPAKKIQAK